MSRSGSTSPSVTHARDQAVSLALKSQRLEKHDPRDRTLLKNIESKLARSKDNPSRHLANTLWPALMIFPIPTIVERAARSFCWPRNPLEDQKLRILAGFAPVSCPRGRRMGSESGQSGVGLRLSKRNKSWNSLRCPCHRLSGTSNTRFMVSFADSEIAADAPIPHSTGPPDKLSGTKPMRRSSPHVPESEEDTARVNEMRGWTAEYRPTPQEDHSGFSS